MKVPYKIYLTHNGILVLNLHLKNKIKELEKTLTELRRIRFKNPKRNEITEAIEQYISDIRRLRDFLNQINDAKPIVEG